MEGSEREDLEGAKTSPRGADGGVMTRRGSGGGEKACLFPERGGLADAGSTLSRDRKMKRENEMESTSRRAGRDS
jgi:hypothetical protein